MVGVLKSSKQKCTHVLSLMENIELSYGGHMLMSLLTSIQSGS